MRKTWHSQFEGIDPDRLVFIDESGAQTNMTRLRGRCPIGQRLVGKAPHGHWKTSTIISAIGLRGAFATAVFDCPTDHEVFSAYVKQVLTPHLRSGDIVIMDNLQSHKGAGIREAIESCKAQLIYLPPYSPDYNPIENMWSKLKSYLRSVAARTWDSLCQSVGDGVQLVSQSDCRGFFQNCGYAIG